MMTIARNGLACHQATVERVESLEKSLNEANRWDADRRLLESLTRNLREAKRKLTAAEHSNEKLNKHLDELKRRERPACQHLDELKKVKEWLSKARATIALQGQKIKDVREHSNAEIEETKKKLMVSRNCSNTLGDRLIDAEEWLEETKKKLVTSEIAVGAVKAHLDRALASKAILEEADKDYRTEINRLNGLVSQASPKWKMHLAAELEDVKEKLFASKNNVKMLSKDLDRVIAARAALKALNADNKLLLDLQKRLIEKQDKSIDELKNLSGHFHQDISNYKAAIKNYRADIDRLLLRNGNYRVEIDRLTKLLSQASLEYRRRNQTAEDCEALVKRQNELIDGLRQENRDHRVEIDRLNKFISQPRDGWRDHTIKTQEIRLKELSDLIGELRRGLRKQKARNTSSDCGTCSRFIEEDLKKCRETIYNLEQQAVAAEMLAANYFDGATEKIEGQSEFIHKLQRESDTMYREKENLLTRLSSKDRRIKKLEAILVRFGFVYNEEKN